MRLNAAGYQVVKFRTFALHSQHRNNYGAIPMVRYRYFVAKTKSLNYQAFKIRASALDMDDRSNWIMVGEERVAEETALLDARKAKAKAEKEAEHQKIIDDYGQKFI